VFGAILRATQSRRQGGNREPWVDLVRCPATAPHRCASSGEECFGGCLRRGALGGHPEWRRQLRTCA